MKTKSASYWLHFFHPLLIERNHFRFSLILIEKSQASIKVTPDTTYISNVKNRFFLLTISFCFSFNTCTCQLTKSLIHMLIKRQQHLFTSRFRKPNNEQKKKENPINDPNCKISSLMPMDKKCDTLQFTHTLQLYRRHVFRADLSSSFSLYSLDD